MIPEMTENKSISIVRTIALFVMISCALGSLGLTLYAGQHNNSILLVLLFAIWVLSPFIALLVANVISKSWLAMTRLTLYILMMFIPLGSLISYSIVVSQQVSKPAFIFLVVPLLSWLLLIVVIPITMMVSRKHSQVNKGI